MGYGLRLLGSMLFPVLIFVAGIWVWRHYISILGYLIPITVIYLAFVYGTLECVSRCTDKLNTFSMAHARGLFYSGCLLIVISYPEWGNVFEGEARWNVHEFIVRGGNHTDPLLEHISDLETLKSYVKNISNAMPNKPHRSMPEIDTLIGHCYEHLHFSWRKAFHSLGDLSTHNHSCLDDSHLTNVALKISGKPLHGYTHSAHFYVSCKFGVCSAGPPMIKTKPTTECYEVWFDSVLVLLAGWLMAIGLWPIRPELKTYYKVWELKAMPGVLRKPERYIPFFAWFWRLTWGFVAFEFQHFSFICLLAALPRQPIRIVVKMNLLPIPEFMANQVETTFLLGDSFITLISFAVCLRLLGLFPETEWLWKVVVMVEGRLTKAFITSAIIILGFMYMAVFILAPVLQGLGWTNLSMMFLSPLMGDSPVEVSDIVQQRSYFVVLGIVMMVMFHILIVVLVQDVMIGIVSKSSEIANDESMFQDWVKQDDFHQELFKEFGTCPIYKRLGTDGETPKETWYFADWFSLKEISKGSKAMV